MLRGFAQNPYSSAKTVFALRWLIPGTNCAENGERSLHIVAQATINLNVLVNGGFKFVIESNAHPDFEDDIWLKNVRIRFAQII